MIIQARFSATQSNLGYQFYTAAGTLIGSRITAGISAGPETGLYLADATVPATAVGVYWNDTVTLAVASEDLRDSNAIAAADQILLGELYTPAAGPSIIIPAPDTDESLTVVYIYTESIINVKRSGIVITFSLVTTPAKSERVLETAAKSMETDAAGYAQISLQSGHNYRVVSRELGISRTVFIDGDTFNLLSII